MLNLKLLPQAATISAMPLLDATHVSNVFACENTAIALDTCSANVRSCRQFVGIGLSPILLMSVNRIGVSFMPLSYVFTALKILFLLVLSVPLGPRNPLTKARLLRVFKSILIAFFSDAYFAMRHPTYFGVLALKECVKTLDLFTGRAKLEPLWSNRVISFALIFLVRVKRLALVASPSMSVLCCTASEERKRFYLKALYTALMTLWPSLTIFFPHVFRGCLLARIAITYSSLAIFSSLKHLAGEIFRTFSTALYSGGCGIIHHSLTLLTGMAHAPDVPTSRRALLPPLYHELCLNGSGTDS
jgi:hypothetical protein